MSTKTIKSTEDILLVLKEKGRATAKQLGTTLGHMARLERQELVRFVGVIKGVRGRPANAYQLTRKGAAKARRLASK